jgi:hypothetical protein
MRDGTTVAFQTRKPKGVNRVYKGIIGAILGWVFACNAHAVVITIDEFTGDDAQMNVTILDEAPGVTAEWAFTASSANTGDITGVWLGIIDSTFNPTSISASEVTILSDLPTGVSYTVHIGSSIDFGGINLTGESGFALMFDFDLALTQGDAPPGNEIISNLKVGIGTAGLTADMFDAAGARLQTVGASGDGSSKLAGGIIATVPEPTTLSLLGAGLLLAGFAARRKSRIGDRSKG